MNPLFTARTSVEQVESGLLLAPKFDANGNCDRIEETNRLKNIATYKDNLINF